MAYIKQYWGWKYSKHLNLLKKKEKKIDTFLEKY